MINVKRPEPRNSVDVKNRFATKIISIQLVHTIDCGPGRRGGIIRPLLEPARLSKARPARAVPIEVPPDAFQFARRRLPCDVPMGHLFGD